MSFFELILILFLFSTFYNFVLLLVCVNNKSPVIFLKFFFLSILFSAWLALAVQQYNDIAYLSTRQVLGNLLISLWCFMSLYSNKNLKLALFSTFLNRFKNAVINKENKKIILMIFSISSIQLISFSPLISLNFLSGPSSLYWYEFIYLIICILGLSINKKFVDRLKAYEIIKAKEFIKYASHSDYFGNLIFFLGLFLLSMGTTGGSWSIIGPIAILLLMHKVIIPEERERVTSK